MSDLDPNPEHDRVYRLLRRVDSAGPTRSTVDRYFRDPSGLLPPPNSPEIRTKVWSNSTADDADAIPLKLYQLLSACSLAAAVVTVVTGTNSVAITALLFAFSALLAAAPVLSARLPAYRPRQRAVLGYAPNRNTPGSSTAPVPLRLVTVFESIRADLVASQGWKHLSAVEKPDLESVRDDFYDQARHLHTLMFARRVDRDGNVLLDADITVVRDLFPAETDRIVKLLDSFNEYTQTVLDSTNTPRPIEDSRAWAAVERARLTVSEREQIRRQLPGNDT